jgi:hypothetical protein
MVLGALGSLGPDLRAPTPCHKQGLAQGCSDSGHLEPLSPVWMPLHSIGARADGLGPRLWTTLPGDKGRGLHAVGPGHF